VGGDTFPEFQAALREAERQLQWGIDPDKMEAAASKLEAIDPDSRVAVQLRLKATRSRAVRRRPLLPDNVAFVEVPPDKSDLKQDS
jgi:hypothetical protein